MPHIEYKNGQFVTGSRPNNQGSMHVLSKIARRLEAESKKPNVRLTANHQKFLAHFREYEREYKRSLDKLDIAHGIAISKIMDLFVDVLNNPATFLSDPTTFDRLKHFFDAILSTESSSTHSGALNATSNPLLLSHQGIINFFEDLKTNSENGTITLSVRDRILQEANQIISRLNQCSRNLVPGDSSTNRSISDREDPPVYYFGQDNFYGKIPYAERISVALKQLPGYENYRPVMNEQGYLKSSSAGNQFLDRILSVEDYTALFYTQGLVNTPTKISNRATVPDKDDDPKIHSKKRSNDDTSEHPTKKATPDHDTSAKDFFNPPKTLSPENYVAHWQAICAALDEGQKPRYEHDLMHMAFQFMQDMGVEDQEAVSNYMFKISHYFELISPNNPSFDLHSTKALADDLLADITLLMEHHSTMQNGFR